MREDDGASQRRQGREPLGRQDHADTGGRPVGQVGVEPDRDGVDVAAGPGQPGDVGRVRDDDDGRPPRPVGAPGGVDARGGVGQTVCDLPADRRRVAHVQDDPARDPLGRDRCGQVPGLWRVGGEVQRAVPADHHPGRDRARLPRDPHAQQSPPLTGGLHGPREPLDRPVVQPRGERRGVGAAQRLPLVRADHRDGAVEVTREQRPTAGGQCRPRGRGLGGAGGVRRPARREGEGRDEEE